MCPQPTIESLLRFSNCISKGFSPFFLKLSPLPKLLCPFWAYLVILTICSISFFFFLKKEKKNVKSPLSVYLPCLDQFLLNPRTPHP
jgi:hypothetical protein